MKKAKVYVEEEPRKIATQLVDLENEQFNCVILMFDTDVKPVEVVIDPKLKTHDRELVKKVCDKIRKELDGDYNQYRLNHILNQTQKEFEK